jgi:hypothetical protein
MNSNAHHEPHLFFQLLNRTVAVACDEARLAGALKWFLSPFACSPRSADVTVEIKQDGDPPGSYTYVRNGEVARTGPPRRILRHALWDIHGSVLDDAGDYIFLHASVVGRGRALLLPGGEETGKSTTAAALLLEGCEYLSDELGVLTLNGDDDVLPYPKLLTLMPESVQHLPGLEGRLTDRTEGWDDLPDRYVRADQLGARASGPLPAGWVVFLSPDREGPANLTPVGRAKCLQLLGEHCLNLGRHGRTGVERLARLAEESSGFVVSGGTPTERARTLVRLVDGAGRS